MTHCKLKEQWPKNYNLWFNLDAVLNLFEFPLSHWKNGEIPDLYLLIGILGGLR